MCKSFTSKAKSHKSCRRQLSDLTYPPSVFSEYDDSTNGDNSNSNYNHNNNNDNNNGNTDNKHKNINDGNRHFCNS